MYVEIQFFLLYLPLSVVKNDSVLGVTISCVCGYDKDFKNMDGQSLFEKCHFLDQQAYDK